MSTASSSRLLRQHHPEPLLNFNNTHIHLLTPRYPPILHIQRRSLTVFYGGTIQFHSARDYAEHEERRFAEMGMHRGRARRGGLRKSEALG